MDDADWPNRADADAVQPDDFADGADTAPAVPPFLRSRATAADSLSLRLPARVVDSPPKEAVPPQVTEAALKALPIAGLSRRRAGWAAGVLISLWIVAVFARQVGQASAVAARADEVRAENAALSAQVVALQHERAIVQERSFIEFQARAFGLGNMHDQRFVLAANAPLLPPDAPGSASVRLAPEPTPQTPLDSWLALLFGPSR